MFARTTYITQTITFDMNVVAKASVIQFGALIDAAGMGIVDSATKGRMVAMTIRGTQAQYDRVYNAATGMGMGFTPTA